MAISSSGMVQTLQRPPTVTAGQQPAPPRDDERETRAARDEPETREPRRAAPGPGKGTLVDRSA
jgi:hypothetical protein